MADPQYYYTRLCIMYKIMSILFYLLHTFLKAATKDEWPIPEINGTAPKEDMGFPYFTDFCNLTTSMSMSWTRFAGTLHSGTFAQVAGNSE